VQNSRYAYAEPVGVDGASAPTRCSTSGARNYRDVAEAIVSDRTRRTAKRSRALGASPALGAAVCADKSRSDYARAPSGTTPSCCIIVSMSTTIGNR
jgi:hypothetical protein